MLDLKVNEEVYREIKRARNSRYTPMRAFKEIQTRKNLSNLNEWLTQDVENQGNLAMYLAKPNEVGLHKIPTKYIWRTLQGLYLAKNESGKIATTVSFVGDEYDYGITTQEAFDAGFDVRRLPHTKLGSNTLKVNGEIKSDLISPRK